MKDYFKLYSNCIITVGHNRSLLSDLQRDLSELIPNDMVKMLELLSKNNSLGVLEKEYGDENIEVLKEYLNYLMDKDFGFYCDEFDLAVFPELDKNFINPSKITNAIIEVDSNTVIDEILKCSNQLDELGCKNLNIIFYSAIELDDFKKIIDAFDSGRLNSYEIYFKYNELKTSSIIDIVRVSNNKTIKIVVYNSPYFKEINFNKNQLFDLIYIENDIKSFKSCGIVDIKKFNTNMIKFIESLNHNSCLHKKISIDKDGYIKNCPSMAENFGNVKYTTLEKALNHLNFKKYWNITKDQIEVCKDCEFRHICTDCRAYLEEPDNQYSKPLKCGYNPYTNVWEEWSRNPLKHKAIEYYGMKELIKKDA